MERFKIENIMKKWKKSTLHEEEAVYEVETEVIKVARLHADFYIQRYKSETSEHWEKDEERKDYMGLLGEKIFDILLQELCIPSDRNDPVIDWRSIKDYDFYISEIGKIEVKTFDYWCRKVLIKKSEWHGSDYVIVFQFQDALPKEVNLKGWLTKEQVESLPISKKGQVWHDGTCYTPIATAYITDFDSLNPSNKFISKLEKVATLIR